VKEFKLRRLHRQRQRRRNTSSVLNQSELAALFDVPESELKATLKSAGWNFHEDARGLLWASVDTQALQTRTESTGKDSSNDSIESPDTAVSLEPPGNCRSE
jgi:hypothetical protein